MSFSFYTMLEDHLTAGQGEQGRGVPLKGVPLRGSVDRFSDLPALVDRLVMLLDSFGVWCRTVHASMLYTCMCLCTCFYLLWQ